MVEQKLSKECIVSNIFLLIRIMPLTSQKPTDSITNMNVGISSITHSLKPIRLKKIKLGPNF